MIKSWKHLLTKFKFEILVLMTSILKVRIMIYTVINSCMQSNNKLYIYLTIQTQVTNLVFNFSLSYVFFTLFLSTEQMNWVHNFADF